jgi:putative flavoprotein involved in K+ transport
MPVGSSLRPGRSSGRVSRGSPRALLRRCCRPIRRGTGARRTCRTAPCLWSVGGASGCQIGDELLHTGRTVFLSVSRHRRVPRRFRGKDVTWWLERMGRFEQTIDSFPGRQWPPSVVVTGVNGGYDVNVRQMAADGIRVLGRVLGAREGRVLIARSANEVLDEADEAFAGFLAAARELASA